MKTGERIKTIRKSQGITQAKLAETLYYYVIREGQMKQSHCIRITSNFLQNCILIQ